MDGVQIVSAIVAATAAAGAVLSYFKFKPGQREALDVNVAQGTLNIAQGTLNLVTTELEDQFKRMTTQVRDLETRLTEVKERAEAAEAEARKCTRDLEEERLDRRQEKDRRVEETTRKLEAERRARRLAENREAEHAAEIRRLWVIVSALREAVRQAGITVPEHLLTGGIGVLEDDEAPSNEWSETSADQDQQ